MNNSDMRLRKVMKAVLQNAIKMVPIAVRDGGRTSHSERADLRHCYHEGTVASLDRSMTDFNPFCLQGPHRTQMKATFENSKNDKFIEELGMIIR